MKEITLKDINCPKCKFIWTNKTPTDTDGCEGCREFICDCESCGEQRPINWCHARHICGCKIICMKCIAKHDSECETFLEIVKKRKNWKKNWWVS